MARPHISYHQRYFECTQALSSIELSEEVPHLDSDVLTVGYPMGGENICVTRGVVSWHIRTRGGLPTLSPMDVLLVQSHGSRDVHFDSIHDMLQFLSGISH